MIDEKGKQNSISELVNKDIEKSTNVIYKNEKVQVLKVLIENTTQLKKRVSQAVGVIAP